MKFQMITSVGTSLFAASFLIAGCGGGGSGPSAPHPTATPIPGQPTPTPIPGQPTPTPVNPTPTPTMGPVSLNGQIGFVSTRNGTPDIFLMDAQGNNQREFSALNSTDEERDPTIAPNGARIVWSSNRPNGANIANYEIFTARADGTNVKAYTNDTGDFAPDDTEPTVSPDGTKIAWTTTRGGSKNIAVMDITGDNQAVITDNIGEDSQPAWTSDSRSIAFYSVRNSSRGVYIMNSNGTGQRPLLVSDNNASERYLQPAFSRNGQTLAVTVETAGASTISLRNLDGTPASTSFNAGNGFAYRSQPSFSPDNRLIYLASNANDGRGQIQTSNLDGTGERALTSAGENFEGRFSN